eukprot:CAMPEP_0184478016 /NCGR_PEP_ID=MMETSP0113_2-20130426/137_1 /TAXON_ID=91329 /ORGANISM="Norrisiella sphaerica, Strain BC52" /LENGTH=390 /DNA_ID=CAMNT_0026855649 /DNA_START=184 /DNA_END=1356 /DNA_ORIENTATION=+
MAFDDVADSWRNPYKGKLFNKPTQRGAPGVDVYKGCVIDYKKADVNPKNFLAVLKGDADYAKGKKVLNSTVNDRVFVYFADHGAPGLIAFPRGELHADDLNEALQDMHKKGMYKELVFYLEACESGSMFDDDKLPSDISIYATTAANGRESSWGTYCPPHSKVNGRNLHSCLGDLYSVNWMEDADLGNATESLESQYEVVKKLTTRSHVQQFGELDFDSEAAEDFWGRVTATKTKSPSNPTPNPSPLLKTVSAVDSRDATLASLYSQYTDSDTQNLTLRRRLAQELIQEIEMRQKTDEMFYRIAEISTSKANSPLLREVLEEHLPPRDFDCHRRTIAGYKEMCGTNDVLNDYALKYVRVLVNLCEMTGDTTSVLSAIKQACTENAQNLEA